MRRIRVLIVDDSAVVRRMLSDLIAADPAMEVAGTAASGSIALAKLSQTQPDLITLDVEMPGLDGLETLREVRKLLPRLPVIMFSTLTQRGAVATLDAITLGASDYVSKPTGLSGLQAAMQRVRDDLFPKIRALCPKLGAPAAPLPSAAPIAPRALPVLRAGIAAPRVLVVGCSTGGPNALGLLLPLLPKDFPLPVLVVQHMPPLFTKLLAERLDTRCALRCFEAKDGTALAPGTIWFAPGDFHLAIEGEKTAPRLHVHQDAPEQSCRPAVDVLFRSAARVFGDGTLAVVLTGMGQDGLRGCQEIRAAGGQVVVQDEASSVVWGMPGFVAHAGLAERVLPIDELGTEILARTRARSPVRLAGATQP